MILSDCGRGSAILGFPGQGMLDSSDGTNFAFAGNGAKILLSVPGIFRICFCRPITGVDACDSSIGFTARVGLMTASGPFAQTTICYVGGKCTVSLSGVGLTAGDLLWIADGECGSAEGIEKKGFVDLQNPIAVQEGAGGFTVNLGTLPFKALPGLYRMCWCPQNAICSSTALFRAPAGSLQADCPPGSFASGPASGGIVGNLWLISFGPTGVQKLSTLESISHRGIRKLTYLEPPLKNLTPRTENLPKAAAKPHQSHIGHTCQHPTKKQLQYHQSQSWNQNPSKTQRYGHQTNMVYTTHIDSTDSLADL